ncbi:MFS transporter [Brevundimonas sp. Root1279]|uniref:MFS transporter n=1 Tax=Brevundimonas sp. Root1279 TaxID=1736443 RepID=UPI0006FCFF66|nr:MFS transporter [Brevundimonas sp. Root1279]KQW82516.1 MFS transporter [Brevundimonas sp. Root1279]
MSDAAIIPPAKLSNRAWIMILAGAFIVTLSMGVRQAFGLFLTPLGLDLEVDRQTFGLIVAAQNLLFGVMQPFVGAWADKHGAGKVAVVGAAVYAAGLLIAATAASALGLAIGFGALVGLAMAGCTFTVILGAVGKIVPAEKRTLAFGLVTAGGSLGQFLVVPAAQGLLDALDWRLTLFALAGLIALIAPLALGVAGKPPAALGQDDGPPIREALREAFAHPSFWLLNAGFFVCGFHIAFVGTHLPAYIRDEGLPAQTGAYALALIGLFNIAGSWLWGAWGSKRSKKGLLGLLYALRGVAIAIFLVVPLSSMSVLIFAAAFGFLWLGTVPLTNGLVAQIYGLRHLSALGGIVFLSHQVGAFLGAWLAGLAFDATGSYGPIWIASIALGFMAAAVNLPIREAPISRAAPVPVAAE